MSGSGDVNAAIILTAGGLAGIASWITTYPIDVLKSRIQVILIQLLYIYKYRKQSQINFLKEHYFLFFLCLVK